MYNSYRSFSHSSSVDSHFVLFCVSGVLERLRHLRNSVCQTLGLTKEEVGLMTVSLSKHQLRVDNKINMSESLIILVPQCLFPYDKGRDDYRKLLERSCGFFPQKFQEGVNLTDCFVFFFFCTPLSSRERESSRRSTAFVSFPFSPKQNARSLTADYNLS